MLVKDAIIKVVAVAKKNLPNKYNTIVVWLPIREEKDDIFLVTQKELDEGYHWNNWRYIKAEINLNDKQELINYVLVELTEEELKEQKEREDKIRKEDVH